MKARAQRVFAFLRKHQRKVVVGCVVAAGAVVLFLVFGWSTGFDARTSTQTTITRTYSDGVETTVTETTARGKTLWDWLVLLIVPAALGVGTLMINRQMSRRDEAVRMERVEKEKVEREERIEKEQLEKEERTELDRLAREDRYREETLQHYFDAIGKLLLEHNLHEALKKWEPNEKTSCPPIVNVAQTRTIVALRRLDEKRRDEILRFLESSGLLIGEYGLLRCAHMVRIDLSEANLYEANLSGSNLSEANLAGANLLSAVMKKTRLIDVEMTKSNLGHANLEDACLFTANLNKANLSGAYLVNADLRGAKLRDAHLKDAYLMKADLGGAYIEYHQLQEVYSLEGATMPNNKRYAPNILEEMENAGWWRFQEWKD
ncbi:MAG TPA: pentapeptide repeat-containing protein [Aggregatilinea sp.]|uniref:pentapeptide repeat-containing protein n=1 Tax=Aggregatilinea sp. TaxID=2806333 RepID=UPI002CC13263|nr:pentapeptide repeat-containing protein [Aggregatilinea sp.]HML24625.1 pentapeptide repeat-containing protein [Aggregatilinea sp.]